MEGLEYNFYEIFNLDDEREVFAFLNSKAVPVDNSLYDHVIFDSDIESSFAKSLDTDPDVKLFFKILPRFKINTPIGNYNPDWAIYLDTPEEKKLYFVVETKGTNNKYELPPDQRYKADCGERHFEATGSGISWKLAKDLQSAKK